MDVDTDTAGLVLEFHAAVGRRMERRATRARVVAELRQTRSIAEIASLLGVRKGKVYDLLDEVPGYSSIRV